MNFKGYSKHPKSDHESHQPKYRFLKLFCKNCQKPGHDTRDCYRKGNDKGKRPYSEGHAQHVSQGVEYDQELDEVGTHHNDHASDDDNEDSFIAFIALTQSSCSPTSTWILDTGATCHLTSRKEWLKDYIPLAKPFPVRFGNNGVEHALGHGTTQIELSDGNFIAIEQVHYIPNIAKNLISVNKLTDDNTSIEFFHNYCIIRYKTSSSRAYVVNCPRQGHLYLLG